MSLNEFLGDDSQRSSPPHANFKADGATALGSWADEMDALPTARTCSRIVVRSSLPLSIHIAAARDDDRGDRRGGRDDFLSSRRGSFVSSASFGPSVNRSCQFKRIDRLTLRGKTFPCLPSPPIRLLLEIWLLT